MTDSYKDHFSKLIRAIVSHLPQGASPMLETFVGAYYHKMPVMDLEQLDAAYACRIAQESFSFFATKTAPQQMRIIRPETSSIGRSDTQLILEIHRDDMPFILDSCMAELSRQGFRFLETIHPIFYVRRNKDGSLKQLVEADETGDLPSGAQAESFVHFELSAMPAGASEEALLETLSQILSSVELVVQDWRKMVDKAQDVTRRIGKLSRLYSVDEIDEAKDFLSWLCEKNFVFLGYVEYDFYDKQGNERLETVPGTELGIFKSDDDELKPRGLTALPPEVLHFAREPHLIDIMKSNRKSVVHRPVLMDYITVKRFDDRGKVIGECRFLGLFTSTVYYQSADRIPFIRRKISRTLDRANFDPMSHNGKLLKSILEFYPRDELFQISEEDLFRFSIGLMSLESKPQVRLFARRDRFERFMSCIVYVPREHFSSYLRKQIISILENAYSGTLSAFYTQLSESALARLHLIISTSPGHIPSVAATDIESRIANITSEWADALRGALIESMGSDVGQQMAHNFIDAFPDAYITQNNTENAVQDIRKMQEAVAADGLAVDIFRRKGEKQHLFHLKIYSYRAERALSDMLPILENMGCRVQEVNPFHISPRWKHGDILIRDFLLEVSETQANNLKDGKPYFEETLIEIWRGHIANDAFNALVLASRLTYREVEILRTYSHYLRQVGFPYSLAYIAEALRKHPAASRSIVDAFIARFAIDGDAIANQPACERHIRAIDDYLATVSNIAEDRIIRRFIDLIEASLRTNYFQPTEDGSHKPYLSIKFQSGRIPGLPQPVPFAEIFVYSMRTEGIHLRGDAVARGGLRWSDRPEDFRTEVLGLVKAQMVKNAVIVPQGAKGGFVLKQPPASGDRAALQEEGIYCYRQFLRGLLDITDNLVEDAVVPPPHVVRYDGDDPYLVVAADKGTASFSDIANALSAEYNFWLGDAFASGGSAGYDHKDMAITAKGGWVSVERHFSEMGQPIESADFTVIGIGDMSGDVFGNGMLLSKRIKLLGAFNHKHIFLDPEPDAKKSFDERQRLFDLAGSQWSDYDPKKISKGGGVFPRDQKEIPLSPQVQAMLGVKLEKTSPEMLIQLLLKAEVDLLWNGGIGTYVKASTETHEEVGDRANNGVRVNGNQLRCKMVGEGGNLGFTQRGRIEYAQAGGRINTDAIDNSGGVDCSDHEVNIKIALGKALSSGSLALEARNHLLESMEDEVARLVLIDNRLQTQAISIAQHQGHMLLEPLARLMQRLENEKFLDREVEFLPSPKQIGELRAKKDGLTRPELAVLLSYSKLALYRDIKDSAMVMSDYFIPDLLRYFPKAMRETYREEILSHRLRGQIVATQITNSIVNRAGIAFASGILEETGMHPCDLARAYVISRDIFSLRALWAQIESLDGNIDPALQAEMFVEIAQFLEHMTLWFLENQSQPLDIEQIVSDYSGGVAQFESCFEAFMSNTLQASYLQHVERFTQRQVPGDLARHIARLEALTSACDIIWVSNHYGIDVETTGRIYFELGAQLRLGWLRRCAMHIKSDAYWDRLASKSIVRELYIQQRRLTTKVLDSASSGEGRNLSVEQWYQSQQKELDRYYRFVEDLKSQEAIDISMLTVALRHVESICSLSS